MRGLRNGRRVAVLSAAVVVALAVAAGVSARTNGETAGSGPVTLGVTLPLTGPFATPGTDAKQGLEACVTQINKHGGMLGRKVQLIVRDNRSDVGTTVDQTQSLISSSHVNFLMATFSTELAFPAETIANQHHMVYLEPSDSSEASHSRGYTYNFGFTLKPVDFIGQTPVDAIAALHKAGEVKTMPKTAAIIYQDNFFPDVIARGLLGGVEKIQGTNKSVNFGKGYLAAQGIKVVYSEKYPENYNDYTTLATQVKASKAQMLFVLTSSGEINVAKAMKTVGYKPQEAFFSEGTYPQFGQSLGSAANGIMVWSTWAPQVRWQGLLNGKPYSNQDFIRDFKAEFGTAPDEDNAQNFTVCQALANAVYATKSLDNTTIRNWFASRTAAHPLKTIQGPFYFTKTGLTAGRDVLLLQWQHGKLQFIYPANHKVFPKLKPIEWPMPNW